MPDITYERIAPLVARATPSGGVLAVVFRCPVSGDTFETRVPLGPPRGEGGVLGAVTGGIGRALRAVLRGGIEVREGGRRGPVSETDRRTALCHAFERVSTRFVWDGGRGQWISVRAAVGIVPELVRQLAEAPPESAADRRVLARMLVEIASADGEIRDQERAFLGQLLPPDLGGVDALAALPPLSAAELAETTAGAERETLLMLAWTVALADADLAEAEARRLEAFAAGLGLAPSLTAELRHHAAVFVVDDAMDRAWPEGRPDADGWREVEALAAALGLDDAALRSIETRYRRRNGLP